MPGDPQSSPVQRGDVLPELTVQIDNRRMFFFAAAVYNGHRIHYDHTWTTQQEGYPNLIVQGHLQSGLLARVVTDWAGPGGRVEKFNVQNRGAAFAGDTLVFGGRVESVMSEGGRTVVELALHGMRDGEVILPGSATVSLAA
ncbi:acyl dehydratase [Mycobacterium sp. 94-17]|uniref:acyl dehydratase n=1 Tax=Mycobacterium sp. 94-17 TaxID=2986147 RepID=UPI002D1E9850|nr:acyl dehydratase [Mycobacterium sp. 94-17]MEB4209736.1 MaoC/PaaZ C-terminal domain-containing protein [Mycobacterium sp. 94-17]